jgi:ABC-2 type transport system ATP-binding protein
VPMRELSLGGRIKCELAGSLIHVPRLLLLDEPPSG